MCLEKVDGGHVNLKAIHAVADPRSRAVSVVRRLHFVLFGSPIPGILQARTLEWVAISFSNA